MKVYLAGSIAAGREFEKNLKLISEILESMGHKVLTKKNVVDNDPRYTNKKNWAGRKRIVKRDKRWLKNADVFIAEVSSYSHGVGYEHCFAETLGKPTLLLRYASLKNQKYSAFLDGTDYNKFQFSFYDEKSLEKILKNFFDKFG